MQDKEAVATHALRVYLPLVGREWNGRASGHHWFQGLGFKRIIGGFYGGLPR